MQHRFLGRGNDSRSEMGGRQQSQGIPFTPASAASPAAASGLRPAFAFVAVASVLALVASRSVWIQIFAAGRQPDVVVRLEAPTPGFTILDRDGRPLALSVECFDVTMSPRAMWRSHTPDRMAAKIAVILDDEQEAEAWTPGRVLRKAMPKDLVEGRIPWRLVPDEPALIVFGDDLVDAARDWVEFGRPEILAGSRDITPPLRGLTVVPIPAAAGPSGEGRSGRRWTLAMEPVACLGRAARVDQFGEWKNKRGEDQTAAPERHTRRMLDDLMALIGRDELLARIPTEAREALDRLAPSDQTERLRDALWAELMPSRFRVLARSVNPTRAHALRKLMADESVSPWQLQLVPRVERRHPTRPNTLPVAPSSGVAIAGPGDAFALLGHWGVLDEERAEARALRDRTSRPHVLPWEDESDPFAAYRKSLVVNRRPWSGIELLCQTELEDGAWAPLAKNVEGRSYERRVRHVARDRRRAWKDGVPDYFEGLSGGTDVPEMQVTLDARLQEVLHAELGALMDAHSPALTMGIALDVTTGDVLALDARSLYGYSGYAPVRHEFTPGSTFKAIIMALALDAGLTSPTTEYDTFTPVGLRIGRRSIGEAEGAPESARITASEGLAYSCNAVLVQIALEFEAAVLRQRLLDLGYSSLPGAGLGPERPGYLPALKRGTWSRSQTHASVGFGHEVSVTLWQHAEALATLMRGGVHRPLRFLRGFARGGEAWDRELEGGERVLSARACEQVRTMMALGADIGTGRHVARLEQNPEFDWIGTKTGTTEKVPSELCVHLELDAQASTAISGRKWTKAQRDSLFDLAKPHRRSSCYTSSMCAAGKATVGGVEREIMVLIVADDPMGPERFGSKVTGPTTIAVLRQAFGFERTYSETGALSERDDFESLAAESSNARARSPKDDRPRLFGGDTSESAAALGGASDAAFNLNWLDDSTPWDPDTLLAPVGSEEAGALAGSSREDR